MLIGWARISRKRPRRKSSRLAFGMSGRFDMLMLYGLFRTIGILRKRTYSANDRQRWTFGTWN